MIKSSVNIGEAIEKKLVEMKISKSEFARRLGIPQQNINRILQKESIDTEKLCLISEALDYNFFDLFATPTVVHTEGAYSPASESGDVSVVVGDALMAERIRSLEALLAEKNARIDELKERINELKKGE